MGTRDPNPFIWTYNVDEVMETLPIPKDERSNVERILIRLAPTAYSAPGVHMSEIWYAIPNQVQDVLNTAIAKEFEDYD